MKIEITEQKAELALAVKKRATMKTLKAMVNEGYGMIYGYLFEVGRQPTGAPYVAYLEMAEEFDIELGFPVAEELPGRGELYMSKTYEGKVVTGTHKGSYQGLERAYHEIFKYIEKNKLDAVGICYDFYLNDPTYIPEDELLTKIVVPVK